MVVFCCIAIILRVLVAIVTMNISTPHQGNSATPNNPKKRGTNFSSMEDVWLARAYAKNSLNPAEGNEKRLKDFWSAIAEDFHLLQASNAPADHTPIQRSYDSLNQRYSKQMQPDIAKFLALKRQNPLPSGTDQETWNHNLMELFKERYGKTFRFKECLVHLQCLPKFASPRASQNPDEMNIKFESGTQSTVPDADRSLGSKASKKRIQEEHNINSFCQDAKKRNKKIESSVEVLVSEMKKNQKMKKELRRMQRKVDSLKDQRNYLVQTGDKVGADKLNTKILELVDRMDYIDGGSSEDDFEQFDTSIDSNSSEK